MLSLALVGLTLAGQRQHAGTTSASLLSSAEVQSQIRAAVDQAVAAREGKLEQRLSEIEQENQKERQQLMRAADSLFDYSRREELKFERSSYGERQ